MPPQRLQVLLGLFHVHPEDRVGGGQVAGHVALEPVVDRGPPRDVAQRPLNERFDDPPHPLQ
jgi:hypothetical protein